MAKKNCRAAAIILQDGKIALMRREKLGHLYYVFPGGRQEDGETSQQAAAREVEEELGLQVAVGRLAARTWFHGREQLYYLCSVTGGQFGSGTGQEIIGPFNPQAGTYLPVWLPVSELHNYPVLPRPVAGLVQASCEHGWPSQPLEFLEEHEGD